MLKIVTNDVETLQRACLSLAEQLTLNECWFSDDITIMDRLTNAVLSEQGLQIEVVLSKD